ncbi:hypothetical protein [Sphingosinicella soli]|uniref:Uncharacterized protein n=1 Tax=Sphingosinicella soli TaxID=333708 RepID=A0A7W7B1Y9_9SPHN|nr:hypothetical protein [Sphingosinicella soli]MBB4632521.1 hypothetical protein [Sphingosinicella soli]
MKLRVQAFTAPVIAAAFLITPSPVSPGQASSVHQRYHADKGLYRMDRGAADMERVDGEALAAVESVLSD